tara:strand:+ start:237 stop:428 length:192 start_codon:yes stop_codon:yes gene_type:complete
MREEVKVGDLVKCDLGRFPGEGVRVGIITGFDEDDDPIVCYYDQTPISDPFYRHHVEVINEVI